MKRGEKTSRDRYPAENKGEPRSRLRSKSGFSLLEILIGATVLAVGLLGVATLFPVAYLNVDSSGKRTEATALAQSFIEQLRTIGANNFDAMAGPFPATGFNGLDTTNCQVNATCLAWQGQVDLANGGQLPQGAGTVLIACQDAGGAPQPCFPSQVSWLANITVTVTWTDLRGPRTMSLMTRVMAGG